MFTERCLYYGMEQPLVTLNTSHFSLCKSQMFLLEEASCPSTLLLVHPRKGWAGMGFHLTAEHTKCWFASAGGGLAALGAALREPLGVIQLATPVPNWCSCAFPSHCIWAERNNGKRVKLLSVLLYVLHCLGWMTWYPKKCGDYCCANSLPGVWDPYKSIFWGTDI